MSNVNALRDVQASEGFSVWEYANMDSVPHKRCTKCGEEYPATTEFFPKSPQGKNGLSSWCKPCRNAYTREWNKKTGGNAAAQRRYRKKPEVRDRNRAYTKMYRLSHPEWSREQSRKSYERRAEFAKERQRRYNKTDKAAASSRRAYWAHRQQKLAQKRQYAIANREKLKIRNQRRRALSLGAEGKFTTLDVQIHYAAQRGRCWWCGKSVGHNYHVDHVIPLSRGGTNNPDNICISCPTCNLRKGAKLPSEFAGRLF